MKIIRNSLRALMISIGLFMAASMFIPTPATALHPGADVCSNNGRSRNILSIPTWDHYLQKVDDTSENPSGDCAISNFSFPGDLWLVVIAVIEILLRIGVILAVGYTIYGGISMIISQGNPEKIAGAKATIEQALIGVVITLLSIAIVGFLARSIL